MGYSTRFELKVHEGDLKIENIMAENYDFYGLDYAIGDNGENIESVKWYSHAEDMINLSVKYPNIVFALQGKGEEQGDSWFKYFKNGKMQDCHAKITFDPYDENKLKSIVPR